MSRTLKLSLFLLPALALAACASESPIGPAPAAQPPQLVKTEGGAVIWDNPKAFGPVPQNMVTAGWEVCSGLNTPRTQFMPLGYHPMAKGLDGRPLPTGGFYCVPEQ